MAVLSSLIVNVGSAGPTSFDRDAGHFLYPIAAFDVRRTSKRNSHIATRIRFRQGSWNRDDTLSAPTSKKRPLWTLERTKKSGRVRYLFILISLLQAD